MNLHIALVTCLIIYINFDNFPKNERNIFKKKELVLPSFISFLSHVALLVIK